MIEMRNYSELTEYENKVMNGSDTWRKGLIAMQHNHMDWLTSEELAYCASKETLDKYNFYAEMSDSWATTCSEKKVNASIYLAARDYAA